MTTKQMKANTLKRPGALLLIGLFSLWLIGCAGRAYNDEIVSMIQNGVTTETQLLAWFGPASSRTLYSDGAQLLTWEFTGGTGSPGRLQVRLDAEAKVVAYSGSAHRRY